MRLELLRLISFGPFEGRSLQFASRGSIEVVFGPNEAGKSTTRRAVLGLLFGIPERSQDGHSARGEVRVGGVLADESGRSIEIVRRKGRKNTLFEVKDRSETLIDEAVLAKWVAGMDARAFELTYGLDHVRLREGGDALKTGKGELGESLFAAATGLTSLHALLGELRAEAEELFVARGSKPKLNAAVRAYVESKKRAAELATPAEKWTETQREIEQARSEHATLGAQRAALAQRRARLDALAAGERERAGAEQRLQKTERDLAEVRAQLSVIQPSPELLAHAEAIALLQEKLGQDRKGQLDLPVLAGKLAKLREDAARAAQQVRANATLDDIQAMRLDRPSEAHVRKLAADGEALRSRIEQCAERAVTAEAALEQAQKKLATLEQGSEAAALRDALGIAKSEGDLSARASAERARAASERRGAEARLAALGVEGRSLEDVLELRLPSAEVVAIHARTARELAERSRDASLQEQRLREAQIDGQRDRAALDAEGEVPTEQTLARARAERDAIWAGLRKAKSAPSAKDAKLFEAAVSGADDLADRLRREASRVSRRAQIDTTLQATAQKLEALKRARDEHERDTDAAQRAWAALWTSSGIAARSPEETTSWLSSFEAACAGARRALDLEASAAALEASEQRACEVLRRALAREGEEPDGQATLAELSQTATRLVAAHDAVARQRATEEGALQAAKAERLVVSKLQEALAAERSAWQAAWAEATSKLADGRALATETALAILDALGAALRTADEGDDIAKRIAGIERDAQKFESDVRAVCVACAPDLADRPAADASAELARRSTRATHDRARRDALEQQAARLEAQERTERAALADLAERVAKESSELAVDTRNASAQSEALAAQLEELDERISRAGRHLGSIEAGEARWVESSASDEAAEAQRRLAHVRELAERCARLRLGAAAVGKLLERFRRENQGPVLARAGEVFAKLTLGSFRGLEVGFGEGDEPVLMAVRPDDRKLETSALSEGTLDQLYLALRIASLERLAATRGPMPLLLDDVLIHFDDARAAAALSALHELAAKTQVVLFTHHARVVELARSLPGGAATIHELGSPSGSPAPIRSMLPTA